AALDYVREEQPRVLFIGYGETDELAHAGRYDFVLQALRRADAFVEELWNMLQSMPAYRGTTSLIVTTDHGRGDTPETWRSHGAGFPGSDYTWLGVIGPDTPAVGECENGGGIQSQIAATIASLVGEDFRRAAPFVAAEISGAT